MDERLEAARRALKRGNADFKRLERMGADDPRRPDALGAQDAHSLALLDAQAEAEAVIERVPDERLRVVLERQYLLGDTWDRIAEVLGYTHSYVFVLRKHAEALFGK